MFVGQAVLHVDIHSIKFVLLLLSGYILVLPFLTKLFLSVTEIVPNIHNLSVSFGLKLGLQDVTTRLIRCGYYTGTFRFVASVGVIVKIYKIKGILK